MGDSNPLSKLVLDYWYKVVMVVCVAIFILAGTNLLKAFPIAPTAGISAGGFFIGLGEWINHPLQSAIFPGSALHPPGVISGHPRNNSIIGIIFVLLGAGLVGYGVYLLVKYAA